MIGKEVDQEVDEGYNDQLKFKLKVAEPISHVVQSPLDLKKCQKASREEHLLKEIMKSPREGSGSLSNTEACRNTYIDSFNNISWTSSDDEKIESDNDSNDGDNID
nr:hypothetical protein [Tanacetum cinerariifolium]